MLCLVKLRFQFISNFIQTHKGDISGFHIIIWVILKCHCIVTEASGVTPSVSVKCANSNRDFGAATCFWHIHSPSFNSTFNSSRAVQVTVAQREKLEIPVTLNYASALCNQTHMLNITNKPKLLEPHPNLPNPRQQGSINIYGIRNVPNCWEQNVIYFSSWKSAQIISLSLPPSLPSSPAVSLPLAAHLLLNQPSFTAAKRQNNMCWPATKSLFCDLSTRQEHNCPEKPRRLECANFQLRYTVGMNSWKYSLQKMEGTKNNVQLLFYNCYRLADNS